MLGIQFFAKNVFNPKLLMIVDCIKIKLILKIKITSSCFKAIIHDFIYFTLQAHNSMHIIQYNKQ